MALWEFKNKNKHGNWRSRIVCLDGALSHSGSGFGNCTSARRFKYKYEHPVMPPMIWNRGDKTYLMPLWKEVVKGTTVNDIEWIKPVVKKTEVEVFKFETASSGSMYTTKKFTKPNGEIKFSCTCPGVWRAFDRRCKHIKSLEKQSQ